MRIIPRLSGAAHIRARSVVVTAALSTVLSAALMLTGCVRTSAPDPVSPTPRATPVFANEAEALAAATAAYAAYVKVSDEILADGGKNPERIEQVAKGAAREIAMQGFRKFREGRYTSTGASKISELIQEHYAPQPARGIAMFSAYACLDISEIDVLNAEGISVVTPTRPDYQAFELTFDWVKSNALKLVVASETPWNGKGVCES